MRTIWTSLKTRKKQKDGCAFGSKNSPLRTTLHLHVHKGACFRKGIDKCEGACVGEERCDDYNTKVQAVADSLLYPYDDFLIIDKGKSMGEKSFIYIKDGVFQGYGYFQLNHQIKSLDKIEARLIRIENNRDTQAVIRSFLRRERYQKLINLAEVLVP